MISRASQLYIEKRKAKKNKPKTKSKPKPKKPKQPKRLPKLLTNPPEPLTRDSLMQWLSDTGWVEGFIGKRISPLDRAYFDDYVQECWVQILEVPPEKILEIWYRGKGKFVNYIKSIVMNNIYSLSSHLYKNIRLGRSIERTLTDEQWSMLENEKHSEYDITFCINDFDPSNRNFSFHHGYDKEKCKIIDEDDMVGEDTYDL